MNNTHITPAAAPERISVSSEIEKRIAEFGRSAVRYGAGERGNDDYNTSREALRAAIAAQPAVSAPVVPELVAYLCRQWAWSRETFGPALRTKCIVQHITKELREIEADPHDLAEWVDVIILAMDGFWRHGGKPEDLLSTMQAKQDRNFARTWPDWRTMGEDQAIEHDRSGETAQPAPDAAPQPSPAAPVAAQATQAPPVAWRWRRNWWITDVWELTDDAEPDPARLLTHGDKAITVEPLYTHPAQDDAYARSSSNPRYVLPLDRGHMPRDLVGETQEPLTYPAPPHAAVEAARGVVSAYYDWGRMGYFSPSVEALRDALVAMEKNNV